MNRIDPINTTELDGVACQQCGESGDFEHVSGARVPICDDCFADQTEVCEDCARRFWLSEMERAFGSHGGWYCADCASIYPHVSQRREQAAKADEARK